MMLPPNFPRSLLKSTYRRANEFVMIQLRSSRVPRTHDAFPTLYCTQPFQFCVGLSAQPEILPGYPSTSDTGLTECTVIMDRNGENYEEAESGDVVKTLMVARTIGHHLATFCTDDTLQQAFEIIDSVKAIDFLTHFISLIQFWNTQDSGRAHDGTESSFATRQVWNTDATVDHDRHRWNMDTRRLGCAAPVLATLMMRAGAPMDPKLRDGLLYEIEHEVQGPCRARPVPS